MEPVSASARRRYPVLCAGVAAAMLVTFAVAEIGQVPFLADTGRHCSLSRFASPSTRAVDRGRKAADYRLGRAGIYLLVDLPGRGLTVPAFEAVNFATDESTSSVETIELVIASQPLRFDLGG
jgi:hypothetical protein